MNTWASGYVTDIEYTHGYYPELNPARIRLAFVVNGMTFPEVGTACELGFGQGVSTNIHASSSRVSWWGTDFNPSQAGFAQELSVVSGAKVFDDSFAEFCTRPDLPEFDFIALHGIWSWVSDENRLLIVDFVRRKLKVGGVLYVSYNTFPGWSTTAPLQHLMTEHKNKMGVSGLGMVKQVDGALEFIDRLLNTKPLWARVNPSVTERFAKIAPQNKNYIAHEYFNQEWSPMYFSDMASYLETAKLSFACSANYNDFIDDINLKPEHQKLLNDITDIYFRQTIRDYMVNQQFRKDYWVKGARKLNFAQKVDAMRSQAVVLTTYRADVRLKGTSLFGEFTIVESIYNPILDFLGDYVPKTIGQIEASLKALNLTQIERAVLLLIGQGHLSPAQDAKTIETCKTHALKLNQVLLNIARGSGDVGYLANPVTGGGLPVNRCQQLFLLAFQQGQKSSEQMARFAWNALTALGQRLIKEGKTLETAEDNLNELTAQAGIFNSKLLPILRAHHII